MVAVVHRHLVNIKPVVKWPVQRCTLYARLSLTSQGNYLLSVKLIAYKTALQANSCLLHRFKS